MIQVVVVVAAYIGAQMLADVMSLKIALVAGLSVDAGTFIYPLTFTLRDLVHKAIGRRTARVLIVTAGVINVVMALAFAFAAWLPSDPAVGAQEAFGAVLAPVWRIVAASIVAEVIAELTDTEVYHLWVTRLTRRYEWTRVLASNAISTPLDSLLFCWLAFGGVLPVAVVWSLVISNCLAKAAMTVISLPMIYLTKGEVNDRYA